MLVYMKKLNELWIPLVLVLANLMYKGLFIGSNSVIQEGVKIGDNSIIAAGSVVVKDIHKNCIVAGNPAKIIKERK